jgi:hypothetical protein
MGEEEKRNTKEKDIQNESERVRECVCKSEREIERERVRECVCKSEREREIEREREREKRNCMVLSLHDFIFNLDLMDS